MRKFLLVTILILSRVVFATNVEFFKDFATKTVKARDINIAIVTESGGYPENLLVNKHKIDVNAKSDSFYLMNFYAKINEPSVNVYIIWGGTGGTIDMDSNKQCKFLVVESSSKYKLSKLTYCPPYGKESFVVVESSTVIKVKYNNIVPYAESTDIGIVAYDYKTNQITTIKPTKSDGYYQNKFANLTPKQIYLEATNNSGINADTGLIDTTHVNMYGERYCFKFRSLKKPIHDKYYQLLKKSCSN